MKAFLSYAAEDSSSARLIARLLDFHGLESWMAEQDLRGGERYRERIQSELAVAEVLIVLVSRHSKASGWVAHEVKTFREGTANRLVLPVCLDGTPAGAIDPGLEAFQSIAFDTDLVGGFQDLLRALGREFLDSRTLATRSDGERRKCSLIQRMRYGCWKAYHERTGMGKFTELSLFGHEMDRLVDCLTEEVARYDLRDAAGQPLHPADITSHAAYEVFEDYRNRREPGRFPRAVIVVERIVEAIFQRAQVSPRERRSHQTSLQSH